MTPISVLRRLERLELAVAPEAPILTLTLHYGEDEQTRVDAWRRENADAQEPGVLVITRVYGAFPRSDYVSIGSLTRALPGIKAFLQQQAEADDDWRELAEAFGIDYGAVEAERPAA
jgi:hypothetical protein